MLNYDNNNNIIQYEPNKSGMYFAVNIFNILNYSIDTINQEDYSIRIEEFSSAFIFHVKKQNKSINVLRLDFPNVGLKINSGNSFEFYDKLAQNIKVEAPKASVSIQLPHSILIYSSDNFDVIFTKVIANNFAKFSFKNTTNAQSIELLAYEPNINDNVLTYFPTFSITAYDDIEFKYKRPYFNGYQVISTIAGEDSYLFNPDLSDEEQEEFISGIGNDERTIYFRIEADRYINDSAISSLFTLRLLLPDNVTTHNKFIFIPMQRLSDNTKTYFNTVYGASVVIQKTDFNLFFDGIVYMDVLIDATINAEIPIALDIEGGTYVSTTNKRYLNSSTSYMLYSLSGSTSSTNTQTSSAPYDISDAIIEYSTTFQSSVGYIYTTVLNDVAVDNITTYVSSSIGNISVRYNLENDSTRQYLLPTYVSCVFRISSGSVTKTILEAQIKDNYGRLRWVNIMKDSPVVFTTTAVSGSWVKILVPANNIYLLTPIYQIRLSIQTSSASITIDVSDFRLIGASYDGSQSRFNGYNKTTSCPITYYNAVNVVCNDPGNSDNNSGNTSYTSTTSGGSISSLSTSTTTTTTESTSGTGTTTSTTTGSTSASTTSTTTASQSSSSTSSTSGARTTTSTTFNTSWLSTTTSIGDSTTSSATTIITSPPPTTSTTNTSNTSATTTVTTSTTGTTTTPATTTGGGGGSDTGPGDSTTNTVPTTGPTTRTSATTTATTATTSTTTGQPTTTPITTALPTTTAPATTTAATTSAAATTTQATTTAGDFSTPSGPFNPEAINIPSIVGYKNGKASSKSTDYINTSDSKFMLDTKKSVSILYHKSAMNEYSFDLMNIIIKFNFNGIINVYLIGKLEKENYKEKIDFKILNSKEIEINIDKSEIDKYENFRGLVFEFIGKNKDILEINEIRPIFRYKDL